jgi:hypothetical protein
MRGNSAQESKILPNSDAALQAEGTNLIRYSFPGLSMAKRTMRNDSKNEGEGLQEGARQAGKKLVGRAVGKKSRKLQRC